MSMAKEAKKESKQAAKKEPVKAYSSTVKFESKEEKQFFWHSTAHVLADAVLRVRPEAKLGFGPPIDEGFYYDFDTDPFTAEDLAKIEKEMQKIIKENIPFESVTHTRAQAEKMYRQEPYKLELLREIKDKEVHFNRHGKFSDLCKYTMIGSTGLIGAVKILNTASAYWRGDSKNPQLQRIYAISFPKKEQLDDYIKKKEEAEKRDHRKVGQELDLFMFHEWSPGSPFFLPKGTVIYNELLSFIRSEYAKRGYKEVITPQIFNKGLWETSGHWQHFRENMFTLKVDEQDFALKPMNCPSHLLIYKRGMKSYKDLPLRLADFCFLHRNELRGVLGGMTRARKFSQDDAHIFCTPEQIGDEIKSLLSFIKYVYSDIFGLKFTANLSTRPKESMGDAKLWNEAEASLKEALESEGIKYALKPGEGAFYGPKIDFDVKDAIDRDWQCATIQLDFQMPLKFDATYEGSDGKKHHVVMIHRAILGSLERFLGVMIEHYAGSFPVWLSPVQAKVMTLTDRSINYGRQVVAQMMDAGIRVEANYSSETVQNKVREAQLEKVPYMIVVGDKEEQAGTVAVRTRDGKVKYGVKVQDFIDQVKKEISEKK